MLQPMFDYVPLPLLLQLVDEMLSAYEIARAFNTNIEQASYTVVIKGV